MSYPSVSEYRLYKPRCTVINYRHDPAYIPDKDNNEKEKKRQKGERNERNKA